MSKKLNILFLADTTHQAGAVRDHIQAVTASNVDLFNWYVLNPLAFKTIDKLDFQIFDAVGVHFSIKLHGYYYLSAGLKKKIRAFDGFKFIFLQDEYQKVNQTQNLLYRLGFQALFTLVQPALFNQAYPDKRLKKLKKIQVLTGYVGDALLQLNAPSIADRVIDVSYRSRRCDYRLGCLGQEKTVLATEFLKRAANRNLTLDISVEESDRVYGDAWFDLLKNSKVVLGTESGASIWDRDNRIAKKTKQFLRKHQNASFDTVFEAVLKPYEGNLVYNAISPRVFETAAAKACMVMFVGEYNGICEPNVHYIALEKDFSNLSDVLDKLKDNAYLQAMADRAYTDLIASGLYAKQKLSTVVVDTLNQAFETDFQSSGIDVLSTQDIHALIHKTSEKYKLLNQFRCFYTEFGFVLSNFFRLLFLEPSGTWLSKLRLLAEGAKRYFSYLSPRMKQGHR